MRTLTVLGLVGLVALGSDAGASIVDFYVLVLGGGAIVTVGTAWYVTRRRRRNPKSPTARLPWLIVPVYSTAAIAVTLFDGPHNPLFQARFRLSEASLTREAQRILQARGTGRVPSHRVGLFMVKRVDVVDGQVRFITTSCGVIDSCGVVYSPTSEPKRWQEDVFTPLRGPWWHLMEGF